MATAAYALPGASDAGVVDVAHLTGLRRGREPLGGFVERRRRAARCHSAGSSSGTGGGA
jgi:hypothetical protein